MLEPLAAATGAGLIAEWCRQHLLPQAAVRVAPPRNTTWAYQRTMLWVSAVDATRHWIGGRRRRTAASGTRGSTADTDRCIPSTTPHDDAFVRTWHRQSPPGFSNAIGYDLLLQPWAIANGFVKQSSAPRSTMPLVAANGLTSARSPCTRTPRSPTLHFAAAPRVQQIVRLAAGPGRSPPATLQGCQQSNLFEREIPLRRERTRLSQRASLSLYDHSALGVEKYVVVTPILA